MTIMPVCSYKALRANCFRVLLFTGKS